MEEEWLTKHFKKRKSTALSETWQVSVGHKIKWFILVQYWKEFQSFWKSFDNSKTVKTTNTKDLFIPLFMKDFHKTNENSVYYYYSNIIERNTRQVQTD